MASAENKSMGMMEGKCQNVSFQPVLRFTSETPEQFQSKTFQVLFVISKRNFSRSGPIYF